MEKRGPQLVQLLKGYWYRLFSGSAISSAQSGQVAISGGIIARLFWLEILCWIVNSEKPFRSVDSVCSQELICARGGGVTRRVLVNV